MTSFFLIFKTCIRGGKSTQSSRQPIDSAGVPPAGGFKDGRKIRYSDILRRLYVKTVSHRRTSLLGQRGRVLLAVYLSSISVKFQMLVFGVFEMNNISNISVQAKSFNAQISIIISLSL